MNYGIKEIEEFKAPSKKPWLLVAIIVVAGLIVWQIARFALSRSEQVKSSPDSEQQAKGPEGSTSVTSDAAPAGSVSRSSAQPTAGMNKPGKPPVNLRAEDSPAVSMKDAASELKRAREMVSKGNRIAARSLLLEILDARITQAERDSAEQILSKLNINLAFLPYDMPEKIDHVVKRGDSLDRISKKYGVTVESIRIGNDVKNPNLIKAGDHLRVLDADFSIVVRKGSHDLLLKMNDKYFKRYNVGLGKFDKTPTGTFEIYDRIAEPVWWRPDGKEIPFGHEENILGTRWMAIRATEDTPPVRGYGIHGTWDDKSIGKSESAGCVRMHNSDVEELFNLVPLGTKVTILK